MSEDPSRLDGATSPGDPAAYPGTPGEFAARWNERTEDERAVWLADLVRLSEAADRRPLRPRSFCGVTAAGLGRSVLICIEPPHDRGLAHRDLSGAMFTGPPDRPTGRQYEFRDGHFVDTWNEGIDDSTDPQSMGDQRWPELLLEGVCGCGNPELIVEAMGEYLQRVEQRSAQAPAARPRVDECRIDTPDFLADYLLACMATDLGFTEHGGNIFGSWLADPGKRWLELWHEAAA